MRGSEGCIKCRDEATLIVQTILWRTLLEGRHALAADVGKRNAMVLDLSVHSDCEYTDKQGRTRIQILEEQVRTLQSRVHELENPDIEEQSMVLQNPYNNEPDLRRNVEIESNAEARVSAMLRCVPAGVPQEVHNTLIHSLVAIVSDTGFRLGSIWFREAISYPLRSVAKPHVLPHSALLNAVYLWAARLSRSPELIQHEAAYYQLSESSLQDALVNEQGLDIENISQRRFQAVQGHILFAQYLFTQGRLLEAMYYTNGAMTLAVACGLHRIQPFSIAESGVVPGPYSFSGNGFDLVEPRDAREHHERVCTFWMAFILDRCWSAAIGVPCALIDDAAFTTSIVMPWPMSLGESVSAGNFTTSCGEGHVEGPGTVQGFLFDVHKQSQTEDRSPLVLLAKASALYERSARLAASCVSVSLQDREPILADIRSLTHAIQAFSRTIIPLEQILTQHGNQEAKMLVCERDTFLLVHALVEAAMVRVYSIGHLDLGLEDARLAINHAERILFILEAVSSGAYIGTVDPLFSVIGRAAAEIFLHVRRTAQIRADKLFVSAIRITEALRHCSGTREPTGSLVFAQQASQIAELTSAQ